MIDFWVILNKCDYSDHPVSLFIVNFLAFIFSTSLKSVRWFAVILSKCSFGLPLQCKFLKIVLLPILIIICIYACVWSIFIELCSLALELGNMHRPSYSTIPVCSSDRLLMSLCCLTSTGTPSRKHTILKQCRPVCVLSVNEEGHLWSHSYILI